jgi:hypothetical protein
MSISKSNGRSYNTPADIKQRLEYVKKGTEACRKNNYESVRKAQIKRHAGDPPKGISQDEWGKIHDTRLAERREMVAKIQVKKALRRRTYDRNPFDIVRDGILSIKTKKYGIRPLDIDTRIAQLTLIDYIEKEWYAERPIRIDICKSRRQGISSIVHAIIYVLTGKLTGINSLIISDDQDGSNYLTDITRLYHQKLKEYDPYIMPDFEADNPKKIKFKDKNSLIYIDTARNVAIGRKYLYHIIHASEVAFYLINVEKMFLGLLQTISDMPYTIVVMESTSNGVGNFWHRHWVRAKSKVSEYKAFFFSRLIDPDNRRKFENEEQKELLMSTLNAEEKEDWFDMKDMYPRDEILQRLNWRRYCIENQCGGSVDLFHQEYPKTDEESFLVSGRTRFDKKALRAYRTQVKPPLKQGSFFNGQWEDSDTGDIKIWKEPVKGGETINHRIQPAHKYVCGVDTMRGRLVVETEETSGRKGLDFNSAIILDVTNSEQVARISSQDDADLFGEKVVRLCKWYNRALLGPENNQGQGVIQYAKRVGYYRLYKSIAYDRTLQKETEVIGWHKNDKSQILMEADLASAIRDHILILNDATTVDQLSTYVLDDKGKAAAQEGCWDDDVIALGIAVLLIQHVFLEKDKEVKPEDVPGTWAWHRKRIHEDQRQRERSEWLH